MLRYSDAAPLLETIFYIREKLVTISHVTVLECVVELVACLAAIDADESAFRYSLVAAQCLQLLHGHPEVDRVKIPFLKLAVSLAGILYRSHNNTINLNSNSIKSFVVNFELNLTKVTTNSTTTFSLRTRSIRSTFNKIKHTYKLSEQQQQH